MEERGENNFDKIMMSFENSLYSSIFDGGTKKECFLMNSNKLGCFYATKTKDSTADPFCRIFKFEWPLPLHLRCTGL